MTSKLILIMVYWELIILGTSALYAKDKVLLIDSYHQGYDWSDGIYEGVQRTLYDKVELRVCHMDTKVYSTLSTPDDASSDQIQVAQEQFKINAALKAKEAIDAWQPDVVIAADDNASKYLVVPYLKDSDIPVVFCGVNWDASIYGFPCRNVTGMIEVALTPQLIKAMSEYTQGNRIGFLGGHTLTDQKEVENIQQKFNILLNVVLAEDFGAWKAGFNKLQADCDMMIMFSTSGVKHFDKAVAEQFTLNNTRIPTGCVQAEESTISLMGYTKLPTEQGQWAAEAAIKILSGTSPQDIPVATNKKGQIYLNIPLAEKLNIHFPLSMIKKAKVITHNSSIARTPEGRDIQVSRF